MRVVGFLLCMPLISAILFAIRVFALPCVIPHMAYDDMKDYDKPKFFMSLEEFKKIYAVNPDAYGLKDTTVWRVHNGKSYIIGFRGLDFHRYKQWHKIQNKKSDRDELDAKYREFMMQIVQDDIDRLAEKASTELDQSRELLLQSMENNRSQGLGAMIISNKLEEDKQNGNL